jgi:LEA14-like dessication related protein
VLIGNSTNRPRIVPSAILADSVALRLDRKHERRILMKRHLHVPRRTMIGAMAFGLLVSSGCSSVPRAIDTPRIEVTSLTLIESRREFQRYLVSLAITNGNEFPIVLEGLEFYLRLTGEGFLEGERTEPMLLAAHATERFRVDVRTPFVSSVSRLMAYLQGPESAIPYELRGKFALDGRPPRSLSFESAGRTPLIVTARP